MFKKVQKKRVLFVDAQNNYVSQLAEYFALQLFESKYDVFSAGPEHDIIDCDMISAMYQAGEDMRRQISKDFANEDHLPKDGRYDFVIYLEKPVFDEYAGKSPWKGRQILAPMKLRSEFTATDDAELYQEYGGVIADVKAWVQENMKDAEHLESLITA